MRGNMQPARGLATRLFWGVARGLALVWIGPALIYNVDWTGHGSWQANAAAVIMILGSALFMEGAHRLRSLVLSPILVVAALFLVYVNTKQAMRTISGDREAASEAKLEKIAGGSHLASQRVALGRRVDAQVKIAGWDAVGALEAVYATVTSSDPRAWAATSQCEDVTATKSGTFCGRVATAKAKVEAARERDRLQAQLDALPVPTGIVALNQKTEVVVDGYIANTMALLTEAGFKPTERLVKAEEALSRAAGFELLAALGPTCWLAFVNMMAFGGAYASAAAARVRKAVAKPEKLTTIDTNNAGAAPILPENADDLDRCIADVFEDAPGGVMKSKDIRPLVRAWFDAKGKKLDEGKLWARMQECFKYDPNNNRPRYLGLKARAKGPPRLALVAGKEA